MDKNENSENGEKDVDAVMAVTGMMTGEVVRVVEQESWSQGGKKGGEREGGKKVKKSR